jgi:ABC-type phosphate transport system substrate-binding protein
MRNITTGLTGTVAVTGLLAVGLPAVTTTSAPAAHAATTPSFTVPAGLAVGFAVAVPKNATRCTAKGLPPGIVAGSHPVAGTSLRSGNPRSLAGYHIYFEGQLRPRNVTYTSFLDCSVASKETVTQFVMRVTAAPAQNDVVGVGSDSTQNLFYQFSADYDASLTAGPHLYSFEATNPFTGSPGDLIIAKSGCPKARRPSSSSAGILAAAGGPLALTANLKDGRSHFCTDFARSSLGRDRAIDPAPGRGGIVFITLAKDAIDYATNAVSNAPANLTTADLAAIYRCTARTWNKVGGKSHAEIDAQLPQTFSGTRVFFLKDIGVTKPGACVDDSKGESPNNLPEEDKGVNKYLQGPNVIYPYSIGKYIAEKYHSAKCLNQACTPVNGVICHAFSGGTNLFGCDMHGTMVLRDINGTAPYRRMGHSYSINPGFSRDFIEIAYVVVRWTKDTPSNIPRYLEPLFGANGWVCKSSTAHTDMTDYGFLPTPLCGSAS